MPGFTVLIPVDGSNLSESAFSLLPFLKTLGFDRVELVTVWELGWDEKEALESRNGAEMQELTEKGSAFGDAYLKRHAQQLLDQGWDVKTSVRIGRPAEEVLEAAKAEHIDLILIATHGRDGLERFRLGSVADKVIRGAACPTLIVGPNVEVDLASYAPQNIFVPVDGSEMSEMALPVARWIARNAGAEIDLARVVSLTPLAYDPSGAVYTADLIQTIEDSARLYLTRVSGGITGVPVKTTLLIGHPGEQLLAFLKENPAGLVVMASHARSGVARAALGSVADRLLHGPAPVLILRPAEDLKSRLVEAAIAGA